ncbi:MAG TPA: hypothetical protein VMH81_23280 [Bryobacteraceae bacterium]|nr:hypothetical protein [Bryobacteraceae bacterium]
MLVIREAQMKAFRTKVLQEFENRRLADIARRFPTRYAELGEAEARSIIQIGVRASEQLDIHSEAAVRSYIDLMIVYGESFDRDSKLAFETAPLRSRRLPADARVSLTMARLGVEPGFHE